MLTGKTLVGALFLLIPCSSAIASPQSDAQPAALAVVQQRPLDRHERLRWFVKSTVGPKSLGAGVISSAWGTGFNNPEEYGTHWDGFAKRYGMRLTGVAASNAIEVGLGSAWGEDPRYPAVGRGKLWSRVGNAAKYTFVAKRSDGSTALAYARYAAIPGSNFMSNAWRAESESTTGAALQRTGLGFAGRLVSNLFEEFWPDARKRLRR
jgi:hypothetical protein